MRVTALLLAVVLLISMPLSVAAAPRALDISPTLSFNGTTALCEVIVSGDTTSDHVEVWMKLMHM